MEILVLRSTNDEVTHELERVIQKIDSHIKSNRKSRIGWQEQLATAIEEKYPPDSELLEGFADKSDEEWQWVD